MVLDDSDSNWWKGSNHRGEGLFPANFCTKDLNEEIESTKPAEKKSVQFNEEVRVKLLNTETVTEIDETKIDRLLYLLHEADPTGERPDSDELIQLEEQCLKMGPLIDQELEVVDKTHASLSSVNSQLVDALNIYCALMKEDTTYSTIPQSPYLQHQPTAQQLLPNYPSQNSNISYGQAPAPIQSPQMQTAPILSYSSPYATSMPMPSMTPTSVPYNHIYSSPNLNQTSTTYTANQIHYGDLNSHQQMVQQPINQTIVDPNTNASNVQQSPINQINYQQQPSSMSLPTNH